MTSCLGLCIENNLIKYAKASREKDSYKVDTFGVKFYTDIKKSIDQIIQETNSSKDPISVNLTDESYQYFNMFAQLGKKDLDKAIRMEFESYCTEKGLNASTIENRYTFVDDELSPERIKVINVSANVSDLNKIKQIFSKYRVESILPVSMTIANLLELNERENIMVVNLEEKTTITTIYGKYISNIQILNDGSRTILDSITRKENSYTNAYEALRNTTIYTSESDINLETGENEQTKYLEDILPNLYPIIAQIQQIANDSMKKIDKIYLTGTLSCVNNIDMYFQEYLASIKCEILKPATIATGRDVNIREYIEVNSAISLALQGLGIGIKGINFKQDIFKMNLGDLFKFKGGSAKKEINVKDFLNFKADIAKDERWFIRICIMLVIFIVSYILFSKILMGQIQNKEDEVQSVINSNNAEISKIEADEKKLSAKTSEYTTLIEELNSINKKISDITDSKYLIPNLLTQIARAVDQRVQIVSISNPSEKHIVIEVKATEYQGIGYFKTKLRTNDILKDVSSGGGMKQGDEIIVTIEGDLP